MPKLKLDRAAIAKLAQGVPQTIMALEQVFGDVDSTLPTTIEEAYAVAGQALALVQVQGVMLSMMAEALDQLESAPRTHIGTVAGQNADDVEITGGTAALTSIAVTSTDKVENLYADRAALADKLGSPHAFPPTATDLPTVITLVNALRAAALEKGL